ncbi:MAG: hypothetical protein ACE5HB_10785 [Terriglobia bacterium]
MDMAWWSGRSPLSRAIERGEVELLTPTKLQPATPEPIAERSAKPEASK